MTVAKTGENRWIASRFRLLACFSRLSVCHRLQPVDTYTEVPVKSLL